MLGRIVLREGTPTSSSLGAFQIRIHPRCTSMSACSGNTAPAMLWVLLISLNSGQSWISIGRGGRAQNLFSSLSSSFFFKKMFLNFFFSFYQIRGELSHGKCLFAASWLPGASHRPPLAQQTARGSPDSVGVSDLSFLPGGPPTHLRALPPCVSSLIGGQPYEPLDPELPVTLSRSLLRPEPAAVLHQRAHRRDRLLAFGRGGRPLMPCRRWFACSSATAARQCCSSRSWPLVALQEPNGGVRGMFGTAFDAACQP